MKRREMLRASVLAGAAAALRPALANAQGAAQSAAQPSELTPRKAVLTHRRNLRDLDGSRFFWMSTRTKLSLCSAT